MMGGVFASILVLLVLAHLTRADDWPQWRGPNRDGVAKGARLPARWPKDPPKPLWKRTIGEGQGSPAVAGGKLFIMGRDMADNETCFALDASTGNVLWKHSYPAPYKPADRSAGTGPKSTPTVDGDRVYMLGVSGMFHCFKTTGGVVWKVDLKKDYWGVARDKDGDDAWWPCCGMATAPLVDRDRLILSVGGKKAGAFTAFDKAKGGIVWKALDDRSS